MRGHLYERLVSWGDTRCPHKAEAPDDEMSALSRQYLTLIWIIIFAHAFLNGHAHHSEQPQHFRVIFIFCTRIVEQNKKISQAITVRA